MSRDDDALRRRALAGDKAAAATWLDRALSSGLAERSKGELYGPHRDREAWSAVLWASGQPWRWREGLPQVAREDQIDERMDVVLEGLFAGMRGKMVLAPVLEFGRMTTPRGRLMPVFAAKSYLVQKSPGRGEHAVPRYGRTFFLRAAEPGGGILVKPTGRIHLQWVTGFESGVTLLQSFFEIEMPYAEFEHDEIEAAMLAGPTWNVDDDAPHGPYDPANMWRVVDAARRNSGRSDRERRRERAALRDVAGAARSLADRIAGGLEPWADDMFDEALDFAYNSAHVSGRNAWSGVTVRTDGRTVREKDLDIDRPPPRTGPLGEVVAVVRLLENPGPSAWNTVFILDLETGSRTVFAAYHGVAFDLPDDLEWIPSDYEGVVLWSADSDQQGRIFSRPSFHGPWRPGRRVP